MSAEKYRDRVAAVVQTVRDQVPHNGWVHRLTASDAFDAVLALCAEIEAETIERCANIARDSGEKLLPLAEQRRASGNSNGASRIALRASEAFEIAAAIRASKP